MSDGLFADGDSDAFADSYAVEDRSASGALRGSARGVNLPVENHPVPHPIRQAAPTTG